MLKVNNIEITEILYNGDSVYNLKYNSTDTYKLEENSSKFTLDIPGNQAQGGIYFHIRGVDYPVKVYNYFPFDVPGVDKFILLEEVQPGENVVIFLGIPPNDNTNNVYNLLVSGGYFKKSTAPTSVNSWFTTLSGGAKSLDSYSTVDLKSNYKAN